MNFMGEKSEEKPFLRLHHKIQRQKFAKDHRNNPDAFWKQVWWMDEIKVELFGHNERSYAWRKKGSTICLARCWIDEAPGSCWSGLQREHSLAEARMDSKKIPADSGSKYYTICKKS